MARKGVRANLKLGRRYVGPGKPEDGAGSREDTEKEVCRLVQRFDQRSRRDQFDHISAHQTYLSIVSGDQGKGVIPLQNTASNCE